MDLTLIPTVFNALSIKTATVAVEQALEEDSIRSPVMIARTTTDASGQTTKARCNSLQHVQPPSIGHGCALGPDALRPHVQQMAHLLEFYTSFYPNGGLPT
jgi:5-methyltetrahydrofolate--homocysteine methyltransferase